MGQGKLTSQKNVGKNYPLKDWGVTVRSLSETSKRTAYMKVLFDVSERERTVGVVVTASHS